MTPPRFDDTLAERLQKLSEKLEHVTRDAKKLATLVNTQVEATGNYQQDGGRDRRDLF